MTRTETSVAGPPTDVVTISMESSAVAEVALGNSVSPQLPTRGTPNVDPVRRASWENDVPPPTVEIIKRGRMFGWKEKPTTVLA